MELISKCDLIGLKPKLYINKNSRYTSLTGGLLSLIIGILSILVFIGFGYNLFARKNPTAYISKEETKNPQINSTEPYFLFAPHLVFGARLNEKFDKKFSFKFSYVNADGVSPERKDNLTYIRNYDMVHCLQTKKFQENYYNITHNLILPPEDYYCIPDNMTFPIESKFGQPKFGYYGVYFDFCAKTSKEPSLCYSVEEVQKMYNNLYMHFIYLNTFVDSQNYLNPIQNIYSSDLNMGNTNSQRQDYYFFKQIELFSDLGWFMESYDVKSTFQFSYTTNDITSPSVDYLFFYIISMDTLKDVYYRKYLKIQEVLANAGGFVKFCMLIVTMLNNFLTRKTMLESIYLSLMDKYDTKIQFQSSQSNNDINVFNINSKKMDMIINKYKNENTNIIPSKFNRFYTKNLEQSNIKLNSNIQDLDCNNPFKKQKSNWKKLTCLEKIICFDSKITNQNTLTVLNILERNLVGTLTIENILMMKKLNEGRNKLLYGENGSKLLKILLFTNYLNFPIKEQSELINIDQLINNFNRDCKQENYGNSKFVLQNYINNRLK